MIIRLFITFVFFSCFSFFSAQAVYNNKTFSNGNAELIGIANDTAFIARSRRCVATFNTASSKLSITARIASFHDGHTEIDSVLESFENDEYITFTGVVDGNIFELLNEENAARDLILEGELVFSDNRQPVIANYRISRALNPYQSDNNSNTNIRPLMIDLNFFFSPQKMNDKKIGYFANPMELFIQGATINFLD